MTETPEQRYYRLVGAQIRRDRMNAGITLQQLADETGLSVSMLSTLERGENGISAWRLQVICDYFAWGVTAFLKAAGVSA